MFRRCTSCRFNWKSREAFLADNAVELVGYQVHFEALTEGLFLFNHTVPDCQTTLSFKAGVFKDLYVGPIFAERLTGTGECPGHCLRSHDLKPCGNKCECAYVREVIQIIRKWPKRPAA